MAVIIVRIREYGLVKHRKSCIINLKVGVVKAFGDIMPLLQSKCEINS